MMSEPAALRPGRVVRTRVPATSANLGPGFDHLGLGLGWYDRAEVEVLAEGVVIEVTGEGADRVPRDRSHLLVSSLDTGLADLGCRAPGLRLTATNTIPHGRGLGSSAAAIVAGLAAAWGLAHPGEELDRCWLLRLADQIEGHPDNVAATIGGGFQIAYRCGGEGQGPVAAVAGAVHPELAAAAYVPTRPVSTKAARGVLPEQVPFADAAVNAGRAALLVHAIGHAPEQLFEATFDRLHQDARGALMPASVQLITSLRGQGYAAFISGAGPTVLVLGERAALTGTPQAEGFVRHDLEIGHGVELVG